MSPTGICENDEDQAGLCVTGTTTFTFNYSSNWFPSTENATPEYPRGAPQGQPDVSFLSEQNLVLSLAVAGLHLLPSNTWREEAATREWD